MDEKNSDKRDLTSLIQVILTVLLLLAADMVGGSPCTVTVTSQYVYCNNESIADIPQELPNNITYLNLDYNLIKSIKTRDLQGYRQLRHVHINNNRIETVDVEVFSHLTQLRTVYLSYNRLTHVNNTIFINNTKLVELMLNGNKLLFDPASPLLISSSIGYLELEKCGIWQISNMTFSEMESLKFLSISENNILSLDSASFYHNSLQELYIDPADKIKSTLIELCSKNFNLNIYFYVAYKNNLQSFCKGDSTTETLTNMKLNLTSPKETTISQSTKASLTSASPNVTVTTDVRAESTTQCDKMDRILVILFASLTLVTSGLSVILLLLHCRKQKSNTKKGTETPLQNGNKPETSTSPEYLHLLVGDDQVSLNDGYEVARDYLAGLQPVVKPVLPSGNAPLRPLPRLPPQPPCRVDSYHEYETVERQ